MTPPSKTRQMPFYKQCPGAVTVVYLLLDLHAVKGLRDTLGAIFYLDLMDNYLVWIWVFLYIKFP